ncbi:DEAD/DEAH box helicase [Catenuloplanes sp. NPDC051500]|uniref:DEAD/DEAH box helicase n=1 Tax=Catenuloplanes sp. NPDC051500 TaxID=3363959 RepID=UPI0037A59730
MPTGAGTFADLPLAPGLAKALHRNGLTTPFPIQSAVLADALAGRDVLGRGRTGSGKTLAFGLPLLTLLDGKKAVSRAPLALILAPTRELAQQVTASLTPYASALRLRMATVVGGLSAAAQAQTLARGVEIVVATPGRLADLVKAGQCRLDQVTTTVIDEADQMSDIGFLPQVSALLDQTPRNGQRMLFSATLDKAVDRLVRRFLTEPVTHGVDPPTGSVTTMRHHLLEVAAGDKLAIAADIAARNPRSIMFVATKRAADRLATRLSATGLPAVALHGGRSQNQRTRALEQFRAGTATILVATNVAARGIHIDELDLVVNVDPPADGKDYLHRGGRTARAGRSGTVFTLVFPEQRREVHRLLTQAGIRPDFDAVTPGHPALIPA